MKNLKSILLALTLGLTTLTSCSSDDNSSDNQVQPQPQNELLGKWDLEKVDMKMIIDGETMIDEKDVPVKQTGLINQYEFFADNTMEYYLYNPASGTNPATEESGEGTYVKNGDQLTLTITNGNTFTIKLLDSNNLHLNISQEEIEEGVNYSMDMTQKFVKMK
ncbi:lipocalin family protein [Flavobacterium sp. I3-2]|uniref:lipocalin family protein n=1 Tax=Flavobacterium sp. I3-2 TaxID=2748319 RepID=UPI0015AD81C6|nr:lipocalin family protein [Flavobacterium sp. I3-2]